MQSLPAAFYCPHKAGSSPGQNLVWPCLPSVSRSRHHLPARLSLRARAERQPSTGNVDQLQRNRHQQAWAQPPPPPPPRTQGYEPPPPPPGGPNGSDDGGINNFIKAVIAGAFLFGMGSGVWLSSEVSLHPNNVASTELLDRKTPNAEVCVANGYSSMVFDQRLFVSFNPFNVYVAQPEIKPGCVLRRSNVNVLESRKLVSGAEVNSCKRNMNTFAFVGDLEKSPEVSCVYHSEDAENQFLKDPRTARLGDGYQPRLKPGSASPAVEPGVIGEGG